MAKIVICEYCGLKQKTNGGKAFRCCGVEQLIETHLLRPNNLANGLNGADTYITPAPVQSAVGNKQVANVPQRQVVQQSNTPVENPQVNTLPYNNSSVATSGSNQEGKEGSLSLKDVLPDDATSEDFYTCSECGFEYIKVGMGRCPNCNEVLEWQ